MNSSSTVGGIFPTYTVVCSATTCFAGVGIGADLACNGSMGIPIGGIGIPMGGICMKGFGGGKRGGKPAYRYGGACWYGFIAVMGWGRMG